MRSARPGPGAPPAGWHAATLLAALLVAAAPARAQLVETSIDMNYTYEQEHLGDNVTATTQFQQKYLIRLDTALTSSLDFHGALNLELDDKWDTDAATTSKVTPNLELGALGPQSAARFTYSGVISKTRAFEEIGETTQYSNTYNLDFELTPEYWPELKFKLEEQRDYQRQATESTGRSVELQLRDDIFDVRTELLLRFDTQNDKLPETQDSDTIDWSWKATYKESLYGGVDFEVAYEIKESYTEDSARGAFSSLDETYTHTLKARLKKPLELTPRLNGSVMWEYSFEQDLLELEYDYKVKNKYGLDLRYDVLPSLKVAAEAKREANSEVAAEGAEDVGDVTDTLKASFDFEPLNWLRLGGRGELKYEDAIEEDTGASVDQEDDKQYELTLKNKFGDVWDLAASTSGSWSYSDDVLRDREAKLKVGLKLRLFKWTSTDMSVTGTHETSRKEKWDELGLPTGDTSTSDAKLRFEIRTLLLGLLRTTFSHEYSQKITRESDEVLNYEREVGYNEDTRLNVVVDDLIEDLRLEGEIERKADDTEEDAEEMVVEMLYSLKLDWKYKDLSLTSGFKYNDRGAEEDDDMELAAKVSWKRDELDISGEYSFGKTYAEEMDESRKLNFKFSYRF